MELRLELEAKEKQRQKVAQELADKTAQDLADKEELEAAETAAALADGAGGSDDVLSPLPVR